MFKYKHVCAYVCIDVSVYIHVCVYVCLCAKGAGFCVIHMAMLL